MIEHFAQWLDNYFLPNWQWLLPILTFLEGLVIISLAAPGLAAIALAGYYVGMGELPLFWVIVLTFLGTVSGDLVSYSIGRTVLKRFSSRSILGREIEMAVSRFARKTIWFVPIYNFTAYGRAFGPASYGALKAPFTSWILLDFMGAAVWSTLMVSLAYGVGRSAKTIESGLHIPNAVEWILLLVFLVWAVSLIVGVWRVIRRVREEERIKG